MARFSGERSTHMFRFVLPIAISVFFLIGFAKFLSIGSGTDFSVRAFTPLTWLLPGMIGMQYFAQNRSTFGYEMLRAVSRRTYVKALFLGYVTTALEIAPSATG